jgi:anti-repressor protein
MSAKRLNKILEELKVQRKVNGQWILYAPYIGQGYVHSKPFDITRHDGRPDVVMNTEWTQKGRLFLYDGLKNHGIIPLIEQ